MKRFQSLLAEAETGRGSVLLFSGPAGIGKTRLLDETASFATTVGRAQVVGARCQPGDALRPLSGLTDLIPQLLELRGAVGCDPRAFERLTRLGEIEERGSQLAALPNDGRESASVRRDQLREAILDLLAAVSGEQTLVVQIDDFQWSDTAARWLWDSVLASTGDHRILWCLAARLDDAADAATLLSKDTGARILSEWLPVLGPHEADTLLERLLSESGATPAPAVREQLLERGGGIPLVLLELVRSWRSSGDLTDVPATLSALISTRLANMSPTARRTLQVSALLGSFSTLERLEHVLQLPRTAFLDALAQLEHGGILTIDRAGAAHGHVLWADAAQSRLEPAVAHVLHRHIAEHFEREMVTSSSPALLWESARHWELGGQSERALEAIVRGAEHLVHNGFYVEAADAYGRALAKSSDAIEQRKLIRRRIDIFHFTGELQALRASIEDHERLSVALDPMYDRHNELEMMAAMASVESGEPLSEIAESVLCCARDDKADGSHRIQSSYNCVRWGCASGRDDIAHEGFHILTSLTPVTHEDQRHRALGEMIYNLDFGDMPKGLAIARDWIPVERQHGSQERICNSYRMLGWAAHMAGDLDTARRALTEGIRIAREEHLSKIMYLCYDILLAVSSDHDEPSVTKGLLDRATDDCKSLAPTYPLVSQTLAFFRAQLAVEERDSDASVPSWQENTFPLAEPSLRARALAVLLGTLQLRQCTSEEETEKHRIAGELGRHFDRLARWIGWPAAIYAEYLDAYKGSTIADAFVRRFMRDVFRETIPPRRLQPFVRRARVANEQGSIASLAS
jgi:hypothetical protein